MNNTRPLPVAAGAVQSIALSLMLRCCAEAAQPEDWDDEEDGEWEAPKVANPKCKEAPGCGEWKRPTKSNPAYKGKWTAPLIDNPEYKVQPFFQSLSLSAFIMLGQ